MRGRPPEGSTWVHWTVACLLVLGLQRAFFAHLPLLGVRPDLVLLFVATLAVFQGPRAGLALGFGLGLAADLLSGRLVGTGAASKALVGYVAGIFGKRVFRENLLAPAAAVALGTVVDQLTFLVAASLFGVRLPWGTGVVYVVLPLLLYHLLLVPLVYPPLLRFDGRVRGEPPGRETVA